MSLPKDVPDEQPHAKVESIDLKITVWFGLMLVLILDCGMLSAYRAGKYEVWRLADTGFGERRSFFRSFCEEGDPDDDGPWSGGCRKISGRRGHVGDMYIALSPFDLPLAFSFYLSTHAVKMSDSLIVIPKPQTVARVVAHTSSRTAVSLLSQMHLKPPQFGEFGSLVRASARRHLDPVKFYHEQDPDCVENHRRDVILRWEDSGRYEDAWPVDVYTTIYLKGMMVHNKQKDHPVRSTPYQHSYSDRTTPRQESVVTSLPSGAVRHSAKVGHKQRSTFVPGAVQRPLRNRYSASSTTSFPPQSSSPTARSRTAISDSTIVNRNTLEPASPAADDPIAQFVHRLALYEDEDENDLVMKFKDVGVVNKRRLILLANLPNRDFWLRKNVPLSQFDFDVVVNGLKQLLDYDVSPSAHNLPPPTSGPLSSHPSFTTSGKMFKSGPPVCDGGSSKRRHMHEALIIWPASVPIPSAYWSKGELTPGIPTEEYERRRRALMQNLPPNSVVVCAAASVKYMSENIFYKYRQASDFWYLTGFEEPSSVLVLLSDPSSSRGYTYILFHAPSSATTAQWEGAKTSPEDVVRTFKADDARPIDELPSALHSLLVRRDYVYVDLPLGNGSARSRGRTASTRSLLKYLTKTSHDNDALLDVLSGNGPTAKRRPLAPEVGRLRAIKSECEHRVMREAADISARAHAKTMRFARPGLSEHALAAHFEYMCAREGAQRPAYVPVVASGPNAMVIHYTANNHVIRDGELVLIDAGCEYNGYASDITRTFPATGHFTSSQAALYSALLATQKAVVKMCTAKAGLSISQLHRRSVDLLKTELRQIGFDLDGMNGEARISELYPHSVGHPVGIDLHESSHFERNSPIKAGMVITVEPGVYVPPLSHYPKHFHNIGMRIEDEVLVGEEHPIVLSVNAPKEIADVEGACQGILGLEPF
ncbi:uncharacterized protein FIBRA_03078 [Fibroporia radiculosa]|uniref:Aminopeptidase P N-terminal domain-containing protein n=1 Tax=Fibroporia radiculosa TaxID=599839 RepID=J4GNA1_9APHY|nr:uncharacterized protein FIBRA_03078 [Fibroporia radiculosa]CCM01030.1 predicted protein [Fibroporia radiculosa]